VGEKEKIVGLTKGKREKRNPDEDSHWRKGASGCQWKKEGRGGSPNRNAEGKGGRKKKRAGNGQE